TPPPAENQRLAKAAATDAPAAAPMDEPKGVKPIEFRVPLLVVHALVQAELKLTADQVRKIRDIVQEVDARDREGNAPAQGTQPGDRAEIANKRVTEKSQALRKALPEILTDTQALRLRQLERQAAGMSAFQDAENVKLLALTEEQRDRVKAIIAEARKVRPPV